MGITTFGVFHTAVGLVAVVCAVIALFRYREILARTGIGQAYIVTTLITAISGLFIFRHGGFGPPHILSIMTIIAVAIGTLAGTTSLFGAKSRVVQAVSFVSTLLFHAIPSVTETSIRLPVGAPLFTSPEDPGLRPIYAVILVAYAIALWLQLRWIRRAPTLAPA